MLSSEPLSNHLIGCSSLQHTLPTGVVGGVEAPQDLFELMVGIDGDGKHFGDDAAIEALNHTIGLWRTRLDMAILCSEFDADLGKRLSEAAAIVRQYVCHAERKRCGRFAQESDGACLCLVVLDGQVDRARAAIDGDIEKALAPFAISGLQLGQMLDVNMDEAKVIVFESALTFEGLCRCRLGSAVRVIRY